MLWIVSSFSWAEINNSYPDKELVDKGHIVAIVEKDPITSQELNWRILQVRQMLPHNSNGISAEEIRKRTLEIMIDEQVGINYALELNLSVTDKEIQDTVNDTARERKTSPDNLERQWVSTGAPKSEFKQEIKRQILLAKLKQTVLRDVIHITPDQIASFIAQHKDEKEPQIELQHILIPVDKSPDQKKTAHELTQKIVNLFHSGHTFESLVVQFSKAPDVSSGGYMGWRYLSTFPLELKKNLINVKVGDIATPIETPVGIEIILIKNKREVNSPFSPRVQKKIQLIELNDATGAQLEDIRKKIIAGKLSFSDAVKMYSSDQDNINFKDKWIDVDELPSAIRNAAINTDTGHISEVISDNGQWYILKITDSKNEGLPLTKQQIIATQMIMDQQGDQEFVNWMASRRKGSYIKIMPNFTKDG
ncbi:MULTISPECIES: peptidylprolyl isomerase [Candidatus Ichthyocystis]|uniref:Putative peptidyl-prolyl cis-trans isomerase n=1 Tax=Candidatus Ichthyocystis hellenicum TaxID=1561003 RepID=A0A0S4M3W9_9BURK|nr:MULTISPECIES: peptidylprolyl isomerase [Ichthyocystis]CUT17538.1 putative peptidyl-prolyl cis-trans isomerase [Candidatus Ichthyocystis hellenicum]